MSRILSVRELCRALSIRDLSDPEQGPHALQILVSDITNALARTWPVRVEIHRRSPIVSVADNYDRLRYPERGAARASRYTRYVCESALLRTHTSAMIPGLLRELSEQHLDDLVLACPGLVYRRDAIDRLHTGEPHQLDLWRIRRGAPLGDDDLRQMIALITSAALPNHSIRTLPAQHPYTERGLQIEVQSGAEWVEIGECGIASRAVLADAGHDVSQVSGLAMGLGLDRVLMLRKGLNDIRLLRSERTEISAQMLDLNPYRPVSSMPAVKRDLSIVRKSLTNSEELGDLIRERLGERADVVESVEIVSDSTAEQLPKHVVKRLGLERGEHNLLVRIVLRALDRTLTHEECNELRDLAYSAIHEGPYWEWAKSSRI